ncbi:MAG: ATP-grasp domain-containing protein [Candidatus Shapirobacteria bacterium]|nr:ATP-grasp domain-containing protein [Candidatus Shapirobacteria bacterium]
MRPILIIAGIKKSLEPFILSSQDLSGKVVFSTWNKVSISKKLNRVFLINGNKRIDMADFSLIYLRVVGKNIDLAHLLTDYLKDKKTIIIDRFWTVYHHDSSKIFQYRLLADHGLPVPKFIYGSAEFINLWGHTLGFPLILKGIHGKQGRQVFLVGNKNELRLLCNRFTVGGGYFKPFSFLAQEFVDNDGDYRVFILGNRVLGTIKKTRQTEGEFRNNVSLGAVVEAASLPANVIKMAIKAAHSCQIDIAGVDVVLDRQKKPFILEVNNAPQFIGFSQATGIDTARAIIDYLIGRAEK